MNAIFSTAHCAAQRLARPRPPRRHAATVPLAITTATTSVTTD